MNETISRTTAAALFAATSLYTLAGCGGVSGIPVNETAARIADTVCTKAYMCCTVDQLSGNGNAGTDVASCETSTTQNYQNILSTLQASVDAGRATYQSQQVDACLNYIMASDCATLDVTNHLAGLPGCASFTTPLVAIGGTCTQNYECIDGWCNVPMSAAHGTCTAFVPYGQSCTAAGGPSCGPNAVCDIEGTASDSSDDLCEPVSGDGGPCTDSLQCTSLNCSSSGASGMTCQEPATPPPAMCFYASGCSAAGGRPGPGTLVLFAAFAAIAFLRSARAGRARRGR